MFLCKADNHIFFFILLFDQCSNRMDQSKMEEYVVGLQLMDDYQFDEERKQLLHLIDGDCFYKSLSWPNMERKIFFEKPLTDRNSTV